MSICRYGGAKCCAGPFEEVCRHEEITHGKRRYVYPTNRREHILISLHSAECIEHYRQQQREGRK